MLKNRSDVIKVAAHSHPNSVAGAIASGVKRYGKVNVSAIGGGAVNQAMKAIGRARGMLITDGYELICFPYFKEEIINGIPKTVTMLRVEPRSKER